MRRQAIYYQGGKTFWELRAGLDANMMMPNAAAAEQADWSYDEEMSFVLFRQPKQWHTGKSGLEIIITKGN
ncbi:hypothetical protein A7976_08635 [Methylobacillus sp. MM3]|nr:hypothetical protein A7976_08635 [Methylobacillus sp. MM3]